MDMDEYNKRHKERINNIDNSKIKYLKNLITRFLLSIILLLITVIGIKFNSDNKELVNKYLFDDTFEFMKSSNILKNKIGNIIPTEINDNSSLVFSSTDLEKNKYIQEEDFTKFEVNPGSPISSLCGGIVVFIGEKDNLGNTIIIQGNNGIDIWYSNITSSNLKLYDYIKKDTILGEAGGENITLKFVKDGKILSYEEYNK